MSSENIVNISTESEFNEEVLQSKLPVLVDFWAAWCGPCRAIAPTLEEIAVEFAGKLKVAKIDVDVDGNAAVSAQYGIRSIPTLIVFKEGKQVDTQIGGGTKAQLTQLFDKHLG